MLIPWTPALETGDAKIDQDHRYIVGRLNDIWSRVDGELDRRMMEDMLLDLCNYCGRHFHHEEDAMVEHRYGGYIPHKLRHKDMLDYFESMMLRFEIVKEVSRDQLRGFVEMLADHIRTEDARMAEYLRGRPAT